MAMSGCNASYCPGTAKCVAAQSSNFSTEAPPHNFIGNVKTLNIGRRKIPSKKRRCIF